MSIWYETRGLVGTEWFMIFCADNKKQGLESTAFVVERWDTDEYAHYEDVQLFPPDTEPKVNRYSGHAERGYQQQFIDSWRRKMGRSPRIVAAGNIRGRRQRG